MMMAARSICRRARSLLYGVRGIVISSSARRGGDDASDGDAIYGKA